MKNVQIPFSHTILRFIHNYKCDAGTKLHPRRMRFLIKVYVSTIVYYNVYKRHICCVSENSIYVYKLAVKIVHEASGLLLDAVYSFITAYLMVSNDIDHNQHTLTEFGLLNFHESSSTT